MRYDPRVVKRAAHAVCTSPNYFVRAPKYRKAILRRSVEVCIEYLFRRIAREYDLKIVDLALMADRVHLPGSTTPRYSPPQIAQLFKGISAGEVFKKFPWRGKTLWASEFWNDGYYWGTVGDETSTEVVLKYVSDQR